MKFSPLTTLSILSFPLYQLSPSAVILFRLPVTVLKKEVKVKKKKKILSYQSDRARKRKLKGKRHFRPPIPS